MIWLLAGDEQQVKSRLENIVGQNKDNVLTFEDNFNIPSIKSQLISLPFFATKQIIVLRKFLKSKDKEGQKEILEMLKTLPETTDLIFVEEELDERTILVKELRKIGTVAVFAELKGPELTKWITQKVKEKNGEITPALAEKLGLMTGPDLIRLNNEIEKLVNYNPKVSADAVSELVDEGFFESIFAFTDALSQKNPRRAIALLEKFMAGENNELYVLSMLARQARNLLIIKDLSKDKNEAEIVKITHLHPFVVKKSLSQVRNFDMSDLLAFHKTILDADLALKTSSTNPKLVLTKLVYSFTK